MAQFPTLKTGAILQYPSERSTQIPTAVFEFVDGTEQRYARMAAPLKQWSIQLELLDEAEVLMLEEFFIEQAGSSGSFAFTDPWDSTNYASCSFEKDQFDFEYRDVGNSAARLTVKENR
jgi:phage-related protein